MYYMYTFELVPILQSSMALCERAHKPELAQRFRAILDRLSQLSDIRFIPPDIVSVTLSSILPE